MGVPVVEPRLKDNTFLGKECKHGHGKVRYKKNRKCVLCSHEDWIQRYAKKHGRPPVSKPYSHRRAAALREDKPTYEGYPCKNGHSGLRYTSNSNCVECIKERREKWRKIGLKYTGRPCKYGHSGLRYSCNGCCVECELVRHSDRQAYSTWYRANIKRDPIVYEKYKLMARLRAQRYQMTERFQKTRDHWLAKRRNTIFLIYPELAR